MNADAALEQSRRRVEVLSARIRLTLIEKKHERALVDGSHAEVVNSGREYAAAVQQYSNAVMAWLSSIEKYGFDKKMQAADSPESSFDSPQG